MIARTNEAWLTQLNGEGSDQQEALSDLRRALLHGLRGALSGRAVVDDAFLEDAVQESLVRILGRLQQFEGRSQFLTWATAIAIRIAMSELRRRRWKDVSLDQMVSDGDFSLGRRLDENAGLDTERDKGAIFEKVFDVIQNQLTDKQRAVLLAELKGMPQDEIARHIGSNRNAVYKLTHDARKRVKRGLESAGYETADILAALAK